MHINDVIIISSRKCLTSTRNDVLNVPLMSSNLQITNSNMCSLFIRNIENYYHYSFSFDTVTPPYIYMYACLNANSLIVESNVLLTHIIIIVIIHWHVIDGSWSSSNNSHLVIMADDAISIDGGCDDGSDTTDTYKQCTIYAFVDIINHDDNEYCRRHAPNQYAYVFNYYDMAQFEHFAWVRKLLV